MHSKNRTKIEMRCFLCKEQDCTHPKNLLTKTQADFLRDYRNICLNFSFWRPPSVAKMAELCGYSRQGFERLKYLLDGHIEHLIEPELDEFQQKVAKLAEEKLSE